VYAAALSRPWLSASGPIFGGDRMTCKPGASQSVHASLLADWSFSLSATRPLNPFFVAVVDATEEAVLNSMLAAPTVVGRDGNYSRGLPPDRVAELLSVAGRI